MESNKMVKYLSAPVILIFIIGLLTGCQDNRTNRADRESLKSKKKEQQQLIEERKDTTYQGSPLFEATLQGSNEAKAKGSGSVTLILEGDCIHIEGQFSGLGSQYIGSYIHQALVRECNS